jgi:hypothetical protein
MISRASTPRALALAVGAVVVTAAAAVRPALAGDPNGAAADTAAAPAEHPPIELPTGVLDRYTGYFALNQSAVITITRAGSQLSAQLTGQPAAEIYPETVASFFYKTVDARIDFIPDPPAQITALVLHQQGLDHMAARIDEAQAQRIAAAVSERGQSQIAARGSEAAVRRLLAGIASGAPDYWRMSPELASATRAQLPQLRSTLDPLGVVQSVLFQGVGDRGWDLYLVHHEHGLSQVRIQIGADGLITGALISAVP